MEESYNKLVRDRIPEIIEENGETPVTHRADDEEYEQRLLDKLEEEVVEFRESGETEELADILEVVHAIRSTKDVSVEQLKLIRTGKNKERGRFEDRIVLDDVED